MATSGSGSTSVTNGKRVLKMTWTLVSQDVANNTSTVNVKVVWSVEATYGLSSGASKTVTVNCLGTTGTSTADPTISSGASKTIFNKDLVVNHNADGTKSGKITVNWPISVTLNSGSTIGPLNISVNATLPTIPRASTVAFSSSSMNAGTAYTVNITRASSSFTHKLTYTFGTGSSLTTGLGANSGVGTSTSFTPPTSLFQSYMTNAYKGTIKITCQTYNGSTLIGSSTASATLTLPSSYGPTVSITVSDPTGYATKYGGYVLGKSTIKVSGTESAKLGASISSRSIVANGTTYNTNPATTGTISSTSNTSISYSIVDSRGYGAAQSQSITILNYQSPNLSNFTVSRCNSDGSANVEGSYLKVTYSLTVSSLNSKNSSTLKITFTGTSSTTVTLSPGYSATNATYIYNAGNNTTSYMVSAVLTDDFGSDSSDDSASGAMLGYMTSSHLSTVLGACKTYASSKANILPLSGGTISGNLTMGSGAINPRYWYVGGNREIDTERNICFFNSGTGAYTHRCRIYGGNASSEISVGFYDEATSKRLFAYMSSVNGFYSNIPIQQHAMTVTRSASMSVGTTATKVSLTSIVGNTGTNELLCVSGDGGIKINSSAVHYVEVSGQLAFSSVGTANTHVTCYLYKNSSNQQTFNKISNNGSTTWTTTCFCKYGLSVTQGDIIYLYAAAASGSGTISDTAGSSILTVRVMG